MTVAEQGWEALVAEARETLSGAVGFIYVRGLAERLTAALEEQAGKLAERDRVTAERCAQIAEKVTAPQYSGAYAGHLAAARSIRSEFNLGAPVTETEPKEDR